MKDFESIQHKVYDLYQLDWMQTHNASINDLLDGIKDVLIDAALSDNLNGDMSLAFDDARWDFENGVGFGGQIYDTFEEFMDELYYEEPEYIRNLLENQINNEEVLSLYEKDLNNFLEDMER